MALWVGGVQVNGLVHEESDDDQMSPSLQGARGGGRRAVFRSSGIQSQNNQNYEKYSAPRSDEYDECQ